MAQYDGSIRINTKIDTKGIQRGESAMKTMFKGVEAGANHAMGSVEKLTNSIKKISGIVATAFVTGKIAAFGKEALNTASDLEAMNAQFSQVFGDMESSASQSLSKIADQAGITEERMKASYTKIAAFAKTSGMDTADALGLADRAMVAVADSAAFYDRSLEETTESLQSFLKGNYENDAALGLSATETTRNAAANELYGQSFIDLSEAQKQVVLLKMVEDANKLSGALGQASRESDTWTNQTGNLNQALTNLKANLGKIILPMAIEVVKRITDIVNALNALIARISTAAGALRSFSELMTGKKSTAGSGIGADQDSIAKIGSDYDSAAEGAEKLADATEEAEKATKKAKKAAEGYLSPLDEINKFTKKEDDEDDKKKNAGDLRLGVGAIDYGKLAEADAETPVNKFFDALHKAFLKKDWEGIGKKVAKKLNKGLKKIYDALDWKKIGPKIEKTADAFTRTLNSLISNVDWDLMGKTVGRGINDIVKTVNLLIDPQKGIDFVNVGGKLSKGFRGLVNEINWKELGNMFGNWFMVSWNVFKGFVDDMWRTSDLTGLNGWQELGKSLAGGIAGLFEKIDFKSIGTSVAKGFNGIFETLKEFTLTMEKNGTWDKIAHNIYTGLNNMIHKINWAENGKTLSNFVIKLLDTIWKVAKNTDWEGLGRGIGEFLSNIDWDRIFGQVFAIITEVVGGLIKGFGDTAAGKFVLAFEAVKLAIKGVKLAGTIKGVINKLGILGSKAVEAGKLAAGSSVNWGVLTKAIGLAAAAMAGFQIGMKLTEVTTSANQDLAETGTYLSQFSAALVQLADQDKLTGEQQMALNNIISELADKGASPVEALTTLRDALSEAGVSSADLSTAAKSAGVDLGDLVVALKDTESGGQMAKTSMDKAGNAAKTAGTDFESLAGKAQGTTSILNDLDITPAKSTIGSLQETVDGVDFERLSRNSETAIRSMNSVWNTSKGPIHDSIKDALIDNIKFDDVLKEKYSGYAAFSVKGYNDKIKELKGEAQTTMQSFAQKGVMDPFADKLGIHSPSTVFSGYGGNIVIGLENGIKDKWGGFSTFWDTKRWNISDKFKNISDTFRRIGGNIMSGMRSGITEKWPELSSTLSSREGDIVNTFSNIREEMKNIGSNIIYGIIDGLHSVWDSLTSWVDTIKDMLTFNVSAPSGGAYSYSVNTPVAYAGIPNLANIHIPHLARGTVVPPNREFMAVLGDNKREHEIVSPVSTMKQANKEAILEVLSELGLTGGNRGANNGTIIIKQYLDKKQVAEAMIKEGKLQQMATGRNIFLLE